MLLQLCWVRIWSIQGNVADNGLVPVVTAVAVVVALADVTFDDEYVVVFVAVAIVVTGLAVDNAGAPAVAHVDG